MGLLTDLFARFPAWRTPPVAAVADPAPTVPANPEPKDKPTVSTTEKIGATLAAGITSQVQFLPYLETTTATTPEVRLAMRRMLREPYVKQAWFSQLFSVCAEEFQVQPYDADDPAAQEHADFIRDGIEGLKLGSAGLMWAILAALGPDGVTVVEPVSEICVTGRWAGYYVPKAAKAKDVQYLYLYGDRFRNVTGVRSIRTPGLAEVDAVDFLITQYGAFFEEVYGFEPFVSSYKEYWWLEGVRALRAIHHEKRSAGTVWASYDDESKKPTLEETMKRLKNNTWAVIPEGVQLNLLELSKASDTDYAAFEKDKITAVVTGIAGAELQMLTADVPDGRGNATVHQKTSDLPKWYLSRLATETINTQFVRRYIDWNFAGVQGYPKFSLGGINADDILSEIDQITKAQAVGFDGNGGRPALSVKHYAKTLGLQLADPRDPSDRLTSPAATSSPSQAGDSQPDLGSLGLAFAEMNARFDKIEKFAEEMRAKKVRGA